MFYDGPLSKDKYFTLGKAYLDKYRDLSDLEALKKQMVEKTAKAVVDGVIPKDEEDYGFNDEYQMLEAIFAESISNRETKFLFADFAVSHMDEAMDIRNYIEIEPDQKPQCEYNFIYWLKVNFYPYLDQMMEYDEIMDNPKMQIHAAGLFLMWLDEVGLDLSYLSPYERKITYESKITQSFYDWFASKILPNYDEVHLAAMYIAMSN